MKRRRVLSNDKERADKTILLPYHRFRKQATAFFPMALDAKLKLRYYARRARKVYDVAAPATFVSASIYASIKRRESYLYAERAREMLCEKKKKGAVWISH